MQIFHFHRTHGSSRVQNPQNCLAALLQPKALRHRACLHTEINCNIEIIKEQKHAARAHHDSGKLQSLLRVFFWFLLWAVLVTPLRCGGFTTRSHSMEGREERCVLNSLQVPDPPLARQMSMWQARITSRSSCTRAEERDMGLSRQHVGTEPAELPILARCQRAARKARHRAARDTQHSKHPWLLGASLGIRLYLCCGHVPWFPRDGNISQNRSLDTTTLKSAHWFLHRLNKIFDFLKLHLISLSLYCLSLICSPFWLFWLEASFFSLS